VDAIESSQRHLAALNDKKLKVEPNGAVKKFAVGEFVLVKRFNGEKSDLKWKGPFRVVGSESNLYECMDLRTGKVTKFDVSMLRSFVGAADVDPVAVAGMDEDEFVVRSVKSHRLEGTKKRNRTYYYFLVEFVDGSEEWLPYMEVRELEAFGEYLKGKGS
jgi:hypothetical protein